jgi:general secretion pathway protein C
LQTINGLDVTSPEGALEAYARLQQAERLVVQVNRRGADVNLEYDIR